VPFQLAGISAFQVAPFGNEPEYVLTADATVTGPVAAAVTVLAETSDDEPSTAAATAEISNIERTGSRVRRRIPGTCRISPPEVVLAGGAVTAHAAGS
jgi:hypothetical protein